LLKDDDLRRELGANAKDTVKKDFLLVRLLEQYLDLFNSFETDYRLNGLPNSLSAQVNPQSE
jgi:trehalose synthase